MPAHPVYFGPGERSLAGWLHLPAAGRARGGVLLCGPVGREHAVAYPSLRLLAELLAEVGLAALRFDYEGVGDSAGSMDDPDRLAGWQDDIRTAMEFLRSAGSPVVSVVGLRLGALLALTALRDEQLISFVAWDPQLTGKRFLREQQLLASVGTGPEAHSAAADGAVHAVGSVFPASLSADLNRLKVDRGAPVLAEDLLLVHRPAEAGQVEPLRHLGSRVAALEVHGQERMLEDVPSRPAVAAVKAIVGHLELAHPGPAARVRVPAHRRQLQLQEPDGSEVVEEFWRSADGLLFGIVCGPSSVPSGGPTVVFLPTGVGHRVGVGDLWVDLARQCAAEGIRSLRLDLSGLGDSDVRPGHGAGEVVTQAAVDDIVQAARDLSPQDPSRVHLVGHCSSAWAALRAAEVLRPPSVHVVHYLPFVEWTADVLAPSVTERSHLRQLLTRARRSGLLPGRADVPGWMWILLDHARVWPSPMRAIVDLVKAGTRVQLLTDEVEAGYFCSVGRLAVSRLPAGGLDIEVLPVRDHGLAALGTRQHVARSLLAGIRAARVAAPPAPDRRTSTLVGAAGRA